jgi:hypothetical protein
MRKRNNGKPFELLISKLHEALKDVSNTQVLRNQKLPNKSGKGKGEIDILIKSIVNGEEFNIAIECKDYKVPISVEKVDAFNSKRQRLVGIHKAILVSNKGFQEGAFESARYYGIYLYTVSEVNGDEINDWLEMNIIRSVIVDEKKILSYTLHPEGNALIIPGDPTTINVKFLKLGDFPVTIFDLFFGYIEENFQENFSRLVNLVLKGPNNERINEPFDYETTASYLPRRGNRLWAQFDTGTKLYFSRIECQVIYTARIVLPESLSVNKYLDLTNKKEKADLVNFKVENREVTMIRAQGGAVELNYLIGLNGNPIPLVWYPDSKTEDEK